MPSMKECARATQKDFCANLWCVNPILRENTKDNTPAVVHYEIVRGDGVKDYSGPKRIRQ